MNCPQEIHDSCRCAPESSNDGEEELQARINEALDEMAKMLNPRRGEQL